jgi:hypothetical protein
MQIICLLAVLPHLVSLSTSLGSLVVAAVACVPAVAGGHDAILAVACCWRH